MAVAREAERGTSEESGRSSTSTSTSTSTESDFVRRPVRGVDPRLLVLVGPTSSGKTELAIEVARILDAEIISADSVQVYRGMDIGSGKATRQQRARAVHHCLDLVDPDEHFDAARFRDHAEAALLSIRPRAKRALVVGGTGLYIRALLRGLAKAAPGSPEIRARLEEDAAAVGPQELHKRLCAVDPELAERLSPRDLPRVLRGLEVYEATGCPLSMHQREHAFRKQLHPALMVGLRWDRDLLRERIEQRCRRMLDQGFLDELRSLRDAGFGPGLRSMQALGYRHMNQFLDRTLSLDEALELQIRDTRRYARRQMTWFKAEPGLQWIDPLHGTTELLRLARDEQ